MVAEKIHKVRNLLPYFKFADEIARESPCVRRQYGCVIAWENETDGVNNWVGASNSRESDCCNSTCARNRFKTFHGERVELGAEIHAETAALIKYGSRRPDDNPVILLVGYITNGKQLKGKDVMPCHVCAINIKFAGFKFIYVRDDDDTIIPVSIAEIIERRELEWEQ